MTYKITAVISVSGVTTEDDAICALEHMLSSWDEHKAEWGRMERSKIDISVKTIKEENN